MTPRIVSLIEKKLIGLSAQMSLLDNKTGLLWQQFSPRIKEITQRISDDKISMQIYPTDYYNLFKPSNVFKKWAAVEVSDFNEIPKNMKTFILENGVYAVFDYKGSSADNSIYQYIFSNWIPNSKYEIDERPHFEVLGKKYRNNDLNSEEEIWIPIKERNS